MERIRSGTRWFFTGLAGFLPLLPQVFWSALRSVQRSIVAFWKDSQSVVEKLADEFQEKAMKSMPNEYDVPVYWACYSVVSFIYLVIWLAQAWLTVEVLRLVLSVIF
jgi:hypothetical protein